MTRLALILAPLAVVALSAAAPAQTPAPVAAAPRTIPGVSAEGMAVVDRYRGKGDAELPPLVRQQRAVHQQLIAATLASPINPDKVATLLKQDEAASAAVRAHLNDQLLLALRELPEADRAPFLRALIRPSATAAAATPAR